MSKIVKDTENRLHSLVTEALGKAIADGVLPAEPIPGFKVEVPADRANGDYSVNAAFACARAFRTAPEKLPMPFRNILTSATHISSPAALRVPDL